MQASTAKPDFVRQLPIGVNESRRTFQVRNGLPAQNASHYAARSCGLLLLKLTRMGSPGITVGSTALLKDTARARQRSDRGSPAAMAGQAGIGMSDRIDLPKRSWNNQIRAINVRCANFPGADRAGAATAEVIVHLTVG
jgi:hypothetical protein